MANQAIQAPQLTLVPPSSESTPTTTADAKAEPTEERSTIAKVGIGAGATLGLGLLGLGIYRLGMWAGWWGASGIVIDDPIRPDTQPDDAKPDTKPKPNDGGGGGSRGRASGKPPNSSGDPEGYNTELYPSPAPVRLGLKLVGYPVPYSSETLNPNSKANADVTRFQREWNRVIQGIDSGSVKLPSSPPEPKWVERLRGSLDTDGIAGKNTLNALEIAVANHARNLNWRDLVKQAGA